MRGFILQRRSFSNGEWLTWCEDTEYHSLQRFQYVNLLLVNGPLKPRLFECNYDAWLEFLRYAHRAGTERYNPVTEFNVRVIEVEKEPEDKELYL